MPQKKVVEQRVTSNITIEDARIGFRNFAGEETEYNRAGVRNFVIFLDSDFATTLAKDGWNVKVRKPRDDDDDPQPYLPVEVSFRNPRLIPKITLISGGVRRLLTEETIKELDAIEIDQVDLIVRPYNWEVSGKSGVKAYLKTMFITMVEDELTRKYRIVPVDIDGQLPLDEA